MQLGILALGYGSLAIRAFIVINGTRSVTFLNLPLARLPKSSRMPT
jgi:hypothetical protein